MKLNINEAILDRDSIIKTIFTKEVLNNLSNSAPEVIIIRNALFGYSTDTDWEAVYSIMLKWMPELKLKYPEDINDLDASYLHK